MGAALKLSEVELQSAVETIQKKYQAEMMEAAMRGDAGATQAIAQKMVHEIQELHAQQLTPQLEPQEQRFYQSEFSTFDLDKFVCEAERHHFEAIKKDPVLSALAERFATDRNSGAAFTASQADMSKHAIKLDLRLTPGLNEVVERCKRILQLNTTPTIHVVASPSINAFALPAGPGQIHIGLTSAVITQMTLAEQAAIIGHELGHVIMGHVSFPLNPILRSGDPSLTPLHVQRLFAWQRACELTADRFSLLCGESFEKSARALFKVSYGFSVQEDEILHSYLGHLALGAQTIKEFVSPEDFYSTHPLPPIRLSALGLFARSFKFGNAVGKPMEIALGDDEVEHQTRELLGMCEASFLDNPALLQEDTNKFMFYACIVVGMSDGFLTDPEIQTLAATLKRDVDITEIQSVLANGPDHAWTMLSQLAPNVQSHLLEEQRLVVLRDLCMIALADGTVASGELDTLRTIAMLLMVNPGFVDHVLSGQVIN